MKELIKNKRNLIIAISVVLIFAISAVAGVLVANAPSNGGFDNNMTATVAEEAPLNIGDRAGNASTVIREGTPISTGAELKNFFINNNNNANAKGYLTGDITDYSTGWYNSTVGAWYNFSGVLEGNGFTITCVDNYTNFENASWSTVTDQDSQNRVRATGLLVGINRGTIKNMTFRYEKKFHVDMDPGYVWAIGAFAGVNRGTIENVKLDLKGQIVCHFVNPGGQYHKTIVGGICGIQAGTLNNAHVNMTSKSADDYALLEGNAKGWLQITGEPAYTSAYTGGVIGVADKSRHTTQNLSIYGDANSVIAAKCDGKGTGNSFNNERFMGSICAWSGRNIKAVISDFKGKFRGTPACYGDGEQSTGAMCYIDQPVGYYNRSGNVNFNGNTSSESYDPILSTLADRSIYYGNETTPTAKNQNSFRIDSGINALSLNFTNDLGKLKVNATPKDNKIVWAVTATGNVNSKQYSGESVAGYENTDTSSGSHRKNINVLLDVTYAFDIDITSGMGYGSFQGVQMRQYNGEDMLSEFKANAMNSIGNTNGIFDDSLAQFIYNDAPVTQMITPVRYDGIRVVSTINDRFAYVDPVTRICVDATSLNLEVLHAVINNVNLTSDWVKAHNISITIPRGSMDSLEYRIADTDAAYIPVTGTSFTYKTDTPQEGIRLEIRGLKNNVVVTDPYKTGVLKIDNVAPTCDFAPEDLTQKWTNKAIEYQFASNDALSGIKSVTINGNAVTRDADGNSTYSFGEHKEYNVVVSDMAGNTVSYAVTPLVDTVVPVINGVNYFTKNGNTEVAYTSGTSVAQTVFARVNYTLGASGGYLMFAPQGSDDFERVDLEDNQLIASIVKTANEGNKYNFKLYSNTLDENDELVFVELSSDVLVIVNQSVITIAKSDINLSTLTKVYDGTNAYSGSITINSEYANQIETSAVFSQVNVGENLIITVTLQPASGFNFAFEDGGVYEFEGATITKKALTVNVHSKTRIYGDENPEFTYDILGLVAGDTIDFEIVCDADRRSNATKNAEFYAIAVANKDADYGNYAPTFNDGELKISKREITEIVVTPDQTAFSDSVNPNIVGKFMGPFGEWIELTTLYSYSKGSSWNGTSDFTNFGTPAPHGKYTYSFIMAREYKDNYINKVNSSVSTGFFYIVDDMIKPGVDYAIAGADEETKVINIDYTNDFIDFNDLITYNDAYLDGKIQIFYGPQEAEEMEIKNRGEYMVTLKLIDDEHYGNWVRTYTLNVVRATVEVELEGIEKVYDGKETKLVLADEYLQKLAALGVAENEIVFTNNSAVDAGEYTVNLSITNDNIVDINLDAVISIAKATLDIEVADIEKVFDNEEVVVELDGTTLNELTALGIAADEIVFSKNNFINAGEYETKLTISNKNFETFEANIKVTITPAEIKDKFEFEVKNDVVYDGNPHTIRLIDEKGYTVKYNAESFINAGTHKFIATISKENYNTIKVEGELIIAKADLQEVVDELGISLGSISKVYDGKASDALLFSDEDIALMEENGISFNYTGDANRQINAGNYYVNGTLSKPNYENAIVSGSIQIRAKQVKIKFEFNGKAYEKDKTTFTAGEEIKVKAYYQDLAGKKVNVNIEVSKVTIGKDKKEKLTKIDIKKGIPEHGKYALTAKIKDSNYKIEKEADIAYFEIKSKTPVVPIAVGSGVGGAVLLGGIAAVVIVFVKKKAA